jgi:hypothetical protein
VLKPEGIIRINFHSLYQRFAYYRSQKLFQLMGLCDDNPGEVEVEIVNETMKALKDKVNLKQRAWQDGFSSSGVLMNHLIQGDKGYTVPEVFELLRKSQLQFLSMVNWRHWDVKDLFKDRDNLPYLWEMGLADASMEEKLHIYELLNPVHRLIDFWCVNAQETTSSSSTNTLISNWTKEDWQQARVYLHPQLQYPPIQEALLTTIRQQIPFEVNLFIPNPTLTPIKIESNMSACLAILWETSQTVAELVQRWLKIQPLNLVTLELVDENIAWQQVIQTIIKLENFLYLLVEKEN